jgi:hypothetical protein
MAHAVGTQTNIHQVLLQALIMTHSCSKIHKQQEKNQCHNPASFPAGLQVAIEGCCHGELDNIYATLAHLEQKEGRKVDLLICCGDFQVRSSPCLLQSSQRCSQLVFKQHYL